MAGVGTARVLVVGHDFGGAAADMLEAEGYDMRRSTLDDALGAVDTFRPDVVVLDASDVQGSVGLCEALWRRSPLPLVIVVGGHLAEVDVVALLKSGADIFVAKPVGARELVARVRASLRRVPPRRSDDPDVIDLAGVHLDRDARRVRVGNVLVRLAPREYEILETLMRSAGQLVPRAALARTRWGGTSEVKSLDVQVRRLRAKLASIDGVRRIEAVRGVGYRFTATIDVVAAERAELEDLAPGVDVRDGFSAFAASVEPSGDARIAPSSLRYT